jgi:hypothetical protein
LLEEVSEAAKNSYAINYIGMSKDPAPTAAYHPEDGRFRFNNSTGYDEDWYWIFYDASNLLRTKKIDCVYNWNISYCCLILMAISVILGFIFVFRIQMY